MLGLVNFDKRKCFVWFIKQVKYTFPPLGPPGPTDDACLMVLVVIFGLEMLGLVNFDNKNC